MATSGNTNKVYWRTKNKKMIDVDLMDVNHLRNAFKHLIKHNAKLLKQANEVVYEYNALVRKRKAERGEASWNLNGDMANQFHESYLSDEDDDRFDEL